MASPALLSDLSQAWLDYKATPNVASLQQERLSEAINQTIDALRQMGTTTAKVASYFDGKEADPGVNLAMSQLAPLLVVGPNTLAYELRRHWNAHLGGAASLAALGIFVHQAVQALNHADYFLDEAEGFFAGPYRYPDTGLQELRNLIYPFPESPSFSLV